MNEESQEVTKTLLDQGADQQGKTNLKD